MKHITDRRRFLGASAVAVAAPSLYAAGATASPGPNETVNLGLIGCGGQGRADMVAHLRCPGTRCVALADVHAGQLALAHKQFGSQAQTFRDYRKLLELKQVDAVIVATHGHWHVLPTIHACQAGKDVYVEKPLGTSIGEGRAAVQAARKYNRIVQIGTQQRSWPHYQQAAELVRSGVLGEISEVKVWDYDYLYPGFGSPPDGDPPPELDWDFWLGPSPKVPYNPNRYIRHYWFFDYGGGWQLDWAVHHYDIVHWFLDVKAPVAATAMGGFLCFEATNTQWPDTFSGICYYGPGPVAKKGFVLQYTFRGGCRREQRSHGKLFCGTEASMLIDRAGFTITPEANRRNKELKELTVVNAFKDEVHIASLQAHAQVFLESIKTRKRPPADVEEGHWSSNPGHLMNIAWRVGRTIRWDAEKEQVIDDPEANALVTKQYRPPWELKV